MTTALAYHRAAKIALARAHRIDEVKGVRDQALAMRYYAIIAKDTDLSRYATEYRLHADDGDVSFLSVTEFTASASG